MIEVVGNPKYKKVYISGPITGIKNDNRDEFIRVSKKFTDLGFETINPHDLFTIEEVEELKMKCLIRNEITENEMWATFMKRHIPAMLTCDFVAVLDKWNLSKGAGIEVKLATDLYMTVINSETLLEIF